MRSAGFPIWFSRRALCVVALLSFIGAAVAPVTHLHLRLAAPADAWIASQSDAGDTIPAPKQPAPHDELGCYVCQVFAAFQAPEPTTAVDVFVTVTRPPASEPAVGRTPLHFSPSRARAPPLA